MGDKSSVKLAYKMFLAPILTSDGHPMLLVWLKTTQEDAPSEQLRILSQQTTSPEPEQPNTSKPLLWEGMTSFPSIILLENNQFIKDAEHRFAASP